MDTTLENNITPVTEQPAPVTVPENLKISQIMINRVVKNTQTKMEVVLRELQINQITSSFNPSMRGRRSRRGAVLNMSLSETFKSVLTTKYTTHITTTDNTLPTLNNELNGIEKQYAAYLQNFGLTYNPPSYRDPFGEIRSLLKAEGFGQIVTNKKLNDLNKIIVEERTKLLNHYNMIGNEIGSRVRELNSTNPTNPKRFRNRSLEEFAETYFNQFLMLRDQARERIRNEYEKLVTEKLERTGHEDHGPTPIL